MESAGALLADGPDLWFTSHLNENVEEIEGVRQLFGCDYATSYERAGLLGPRWVLAHNVHPSLRADDARPGTARPSRTARPRTPRSAAGCSRSAPTSRSGSGSPSAPTSEPAPVSRCSRRGCRPTSPSSSSAARATSSPRAHLLHLATSAGADVLGLSEVIGDFSVGKEFDALWLRPSPDCTLDVALRHADGYDDALAKAFALAGPADVGGSWVAGQRLAIAG